MIFLMLRLLINLSGGRSRGKEATKMNAVLVLSLSVSDLLVSVRELNESSVQCFNL